MLHQHLSYSLGIRVEKLDVAVHACLLDLGRQKQEDPGVLLARQFSRIQEFQVQRETLSQKTKMKSD